MNNILKIQEEIKDNNTDCEQETEKFNSQTESQTFNMCVASIHHLRCKNMMNIKK